VFLLCSFEGVSILDWALVIDRNSTALKPIVEALFAMLGLAGAATRIPRGVHRNLLRLLRPTESAVRRLIVIVARGLVVKPAPARAIPAGTIIGKGNTRGKSFQLFDTRKNFNRKRRRKGKRLIPRIHVLGCDPTVAALWQLQRPSPAAAPPPDGRVDAARLGRRLHALKSALEDLPRQAKRLARWRLKRASISHLKMRYPMRPGLPPGHRAKKTHEIDDILSECHYFAWEALKPDTS
jgi:hypothetical protein